MNVVDSSGWLEYISDGPNAEFFEGPITNLAELIVPSLSIYEVFRRILRTRNEGIALDVAAMMMQGHVVDLDSMLSIRAASLSAATRLPMADSIILETARAFDAILWTQDADFKGLDGVEFRRRQP